MRLQESVTFHPQQFQQLKKLVAQGEGLTLEFKRKAAFPEKIVREMIAFANSKGGVLLVGIGDDLTIPGLKFPEDDSHVIVQAIKKCKPPLQYDELFISIGTTRAVIQYTIPESTVKPHYWLEDNLSKISYIRVADKSIKASKEVREIIRRSQVKKDIRFQYRDHEHALMKYLDENKTITLKKFIEISGLKKFHASRKLILLVLADVLIVSPDERGDVYSLAFKASTFER